MNTTPIEQCDGYKKLLDAVERDEARESGVHDYRGKLAWVLARVQHYAEKTGLDPADLLNAWESRRDYWYMNYYQEANQPEIKDGPVRVFETPQELLASVGKAGFRCPSCEGVSKSPYECDTGQKRDDGSICDWKSYGLFRTLGKGVFVFVKTELRGNHIFYPVAWEPQPVATQS